jgi:hypothetical protein
MPKVKNAAAVRLNLLAAIIQPRAARLHDGRGLREEQAGMQGCRHEQRCDKRDYAVR